MTDVKWIKIVTDIFDDEKILLIEAMPEADGMIVIWFKILCLAGKQNNGGVLMLNNRMAYTDEMLATIFRRPISTVRLALCTFQGLGMIEIISGAVTIPNWGKHQNLEGIQIRREYMRGYMREYREKQKLLASGEQECKLLHKHNVSCAEEEREEEEELDKEREHIASKPRRFAKPTVEEVAAYCKERGNHVNPQSFIDWYESKGWRVGNSPMKDWKAAVRTWEQRDAEKKPAQPKPRVFKIGTADYEET